MIHTHVDLNNQMLLFMFSPMEHTHTKRDFHRFFSQHHYIPIQASTKEHFKSTIKVVYMI